MTSRCLSNFKGPIVSYLSAALSCEQRPFFQISFLLVLLLIHILLLLFSENCKLLLLLLLLLSLFGLAIYYFKILVL